MKSLHVELEYFNWLELDEKGYSHIRDDAPEEIKEYHKKVKELEKQGYK